MLGEVCVSLALFVEDITHVVILLSKARLKTRYLLILIAH